MYIRVAGIVDDSIADGAGLRLALFTQGCKKRCAGCHNPQAQPLDGGTPTSPGAVTALIDANPLLAGVTFTGGEPFLQAAALLPLARAVKERGLHLAIYSGYTFEELLSAPEPEIRPLLECADVLVDGEYVEALSDPALKFRGSANQRVIDVRESLKTGAVITTDWA